MKRINWCEKIIGSAMTHNMELLNHEPHLDQLMLSHTWCQMIRSRAWDDQRLWKCIGSAEYMGLADYGNAWEQLIMRMHGISWVWECMGLDDYENTWDQLIMGMHGISWVWECMETAYYGKAWDQLIMGMHGISWFWECMWSADFGNALD